MILPKYTLLLCILFNVLCLTACNLPPLTSAGEPTGESVSAVPTSTRLPPTPAVGRTDSASVTLASPTAVDATPNVPANWIKSTVPEIGVTLYHPPGWETVTTPQHFTLGLFEPGGPGWLEIARIDPHTDSLYNLTYSPGMAPEEILNPLLDAAVQDGSFEEMTISSTFQGVPISLSFGFYDLLQDDVTIAVIGFADFAVLVTGHVQAVDTDDVDYALTRLTPVYRQVIASIGLP